MNQGSDPRLQEAALRSDADPLAARRPIPEARSRREEQRGEGGADATTGVSSCMDRGSLRVAAALSRMRERERLRSRAGGRSHLVQRERGYSEQHALADSGIQASHVGCAPRRRGIAGGW